MLSNLFIDNSLIALPTKCVEAEDQRYTMTTFVDKSKLA